MANSPADPWLIIIGLGEDGMAGLPAARQTELANAELIFGGARHLALVDAGDRGCPWPVPFSIDPVLAARGRKVAVLASGDPFWFGAGTRLAANLSPEEWIAHPAPSTFSLAASRLGWALEHVACIALHAAPFERLKPVLHSKGRIICLIRDGSAVGSLAKWLTEQGFGSSTFHIMEALGGPQERIRTVKCQQFAYTDVRAPVAVAITLCGPAGLSRASGLPDNTFLHDGQITKRPIRALTLSTLAPRPGDLLWDIGAGSGSISLEWCLASGQAIAVEPRADRTANIRASASALGVEPVIQVVEGRAPQILHDLPAPDAVFIGGGATSTLLEYVWETVPSGTRIVANGVTLETEALLATWYGHKGGDLLRIELANAAPLGTMQGWLPARPIVQWSIVR